MRSTQYNATVFLDEVKIGVLGGPGGRGAVSWRREKFEPKGGPDGGNGGRGGDVILIANDNTDTLSAFSSSKKFQAQRGGYGMGSSRAGKAGEDLELNVPPGTAVYEANTGQLLADLAAPGDRVTIVRGGRGGFGNEHFKSSIRQRPDFAELGEPGEALDLRLVLKLVADVGIIGLPSVGKSTLISVISSAKPKIGDYPFTTLIPNLGVVNVDDRSYVVCDVPGLIEGASEGKGLGDTFLRHIERCGVLVHMLDVTRALHSTDEPDAQILIDDYRVIRGELERYSPLLATKREFVVLNKVDVLPDGGEALEKALKKAGIKLFAKISAATHQGTIDLIKHLLPVVLEERAKAAAVVEEDEQVILRPDLDDPLNMQSFRIEESPDEIRIVGKRMEQMTVMTDFNVEGGVQRWRYIAERSGLSKAIKPLLNKKDRPVMIGDVNVSQYL